jgi:peptidoglycan-associated lipoprotein
MMNGLRGQVKMSKRMELAVMLGIAGALCPVFCAGAQAQEGGRVNVGIDYNYVRTNAPPGGCGCFNLQGGDGWLSFNFSRHFAIVGLVSGQRASDINGSGEDLTLTSFVAGPRYSFAVKRRFAPFAQVLLGGAHASGSLAPGDILVDSSSNAFAMLAGGGLDIGLNRHFAIRALEADYFMTRFNNGVNERQNNIRLSAGVVVRF